MAKLIILISVFLTPLILNFATRELFEFPKMIVVYGLALLALLNLLRQPVRLRLKGRGATVVWAGVIFWSVNLLATLLSVDKATSLFGYYTRFDGGLAALSAYLILSYLTLVRLKPEDITEIAFYAVLGSLIVSLYAVLQHLGIDKNFWVQDSQARVFSTLGQPNWLAAYLLMVLPISVFFLIRAETLKSRIFYFVTAVVNFSAIWFTYSLSGFVGLIFLTIFLPVTLGRQRLRRQAILLSALSIICTLIAASRPGLFATKVKSVFQNLSEKTTVLAAENIEKAQNDLSIDTSSIRLIVWQGAFRLFSSSAKVFLIGTGPETFAYAFLPFRPRELNHTSEWDFLYNKAHNYYLDLATGTGLLGLATYLWLSLAIFRFWRRIKNGPSLLTSLMALGWLTLAVTNIFGWPTVTTSLFFFLYPAFLITATNQPPPTAQPLVLRPATRLGLLALILIGAKITFSIFWADLTFTQAVSLSKQGFLADADLKFAEAIRHNPFEPTYRRESAFNLVQETIGTENREEQKELIQQTLAQAEAAFRLNPKNSLTLKSLLRTYYALARIDPRFETQVQQFAEKVTKLAPTEPRAFYDAALIFSYLGQDETSLRYVEEALNLKPDYPEAKELRQRTEAAAN